MTRYLYGATPSDVTFNSDGGLAPAATITLWNARSGGAQVIDLQTVGGSSISSVTSDSLGFIAFLGPDGYTGTLWADGGVGDRVALFPVEASNAASYLPTASISELSDVDTTTDAPGDGDALVWDTAEGKWAPGSVSGGVVNVIDYGAAGDGTTDDTDAIRDAIDALRDDQTLLIPAGSTFKHTNYLRIDGRQRIRVTGGGTLAHSGDVDGTSSLMLIDCDDVVVSNITLTSSATTRRDGNESHRLFVQDSTSVTIKDIAIDGSQAAGVLLQTVTNFLIENVSASNTLADSFHFTHGSSYGTVRHCSSTGSGDDGFAVVSYDTHPTPCAYINFFHCSVTAQLWGRGLTVVGGDHIDYSDCLVNGSSGAGIYIACEGEYDTYGATNITARDIVLDGCVQQAAEVAGDRPRPDQAQLIHGAVTIYGSRTEYSVDGVHLDGVTILNTEPDGWYEVMLINYHVDEEVKNVDLANFTITTTKTLLTDTLLGDEDYNTRSWVVNGDIEPDHIGFDYRGASLPLTGGTVSGALTLSGDPTSALHAATMQYVDRAIMAAGTLFAARYEKIAYTTTPSDSTGTMSLHDEGGGVWKMMLSRTTQSGITLSTYLAELDSLGYDNYSITVTDEDGASLLLQPNQDPYLTDPYNQAVWFAEEVQSSTSSLNATGNVVIAFLRTMPLPGSPTFTGTVTAPNITASSVLTATAAATYLGATTVSGSLTAERVGDGINAFANILRDAGYIGAVQFGTANAGAGLRWRVGADAGSESGSDAGSDFIVESFTDGGSHLHYPFTIVRSTGVANFSTTPKIGGTLLSGLYASLAGATFTGDITVTPSTYGGFKINGGVHDRYIQWQTSGAKRWDFLVDSSTESGSDAGSNFALYRYNDAGTVNTLVMDGNRATGVINFATTPSIGGVLLTSTYARLASTSTHTRQVFVDGSSDEVQGRFQAHSTQTTNIITAENSSGTAMFRVAPDGEILGYGATFTDRIKAPAATSTNSSIRIPHGSAPSSPSNGDVWTDTSGAYIRINGVTKTFTLT